MENEQSTGFDHREVIDEGGNKLGMVTDVVSDNVSLEPRWLVVDVGVLRTSHYVPVDGSFRTADGHVVVPFSKDQVKHAPKAHSTHVLSPEDERELQQYYDLV